MLIRAGVVDTADDAIALYNKVRIMDYIPFLAWTSRIWILKHQLGWVQTRVSDGKGLTIVSQIRYVRYFESIWRQVRRPVAP
eukprot:23353-Eustigmatos_ZCMA.PRE.1